MSETLDDARVARLAGVPGGLRGFGRRHPEWWAMLAAAGAWIWMIAVPHPHAAHHGHGPPAGPGALAAAAMVVAMMLPLTIPGIRGMALSSTRRHRAVAGFLAGYLAVWMLVMSVLAAGWTFAASLAGWKWAAVGTVAVAALWEAVRPTHRHAEHEHRPGPHAASGWRADADCARHGVTAGIRCVGACWALMAACVAFAHSLPVMVVLFGVQLGGRYGPRIPAGLAALAVLGTGLAAVAARLAAGHAV